MDSSEIHAKAIIAAALITSHAVEIPRVVKADHWSLDPAAVRLRQLTDYVYQTIAESSPDTA